MCWEYPSGIFWKSSIVYYVVRRRPPGGKIKAIQGTDSRISNSHRASVCMMQLIEQLSPSVRYRVLGVSIVYVPCLVQITPHSTSATFTQSKVPYKSISKITVRFLRRDLIYQATWITTYHFFFFSDCNFWIFSCTNFEEHDEHERAKWLS